MFVGGALDISVPLDGSRYMNGADAHFTQQTHALFTHIQGFSVLSYGNFFLRVNLIQKWR